VALLLTTKVNIFPLRGMFTSLCADDRRRALHHVAALRAWAVAKVLETQPSFGEYERMLDNSSVAPGVLRDPLTCVRKPTVFAGQRQEKAD
jgi:hypothetical protein